MDSFLLFLNLKKLDLLKNSPPLWWEDDAISVCVGAILMQNTKWEIAQNALLVLKKSGILTSPERSLQNLSTLDPIILNSHITKVAFHRQKSARIILLAHNILKEFGSFTDFYENASREFLLAQKGLGFESADSILCYGLKREVMVADAYTKRLLFALGLEFEDYNDIADFLKAGILNNLSKFEFSEVTKSKSCVDVQTKALRYKNLNQVFARFHGKIVEFSKKFKPHMAKELLCQALE